MRILQDNLPKRKNWVCIDNTKKELFILIAIIEARRRRRQQTSVETSEPQPPQMPPRKQGGPTVVIAPKSPLELGDSDYEGTNRFEK